MRRKPFNLATLKSVSSGNELLALLSSSPPQFTKRKTEQRIDEDDDESTVRTGEEGTEAANGDTTVRREKLLEISLCVEFRNLIGR